MGKERIDISSMVNSFSQSKNEVAIMAASRGSQVSLEKKSLSNGVFTKALLEGIMQSEKTGFKGNITLFQLFSYVSRRVSKLTNSFQNPTIAIPQSIVDFTIAGK